MFYTYIIPICLIALVSQDDPALHGWLELGLEHQAAEVAPGE